MVPFALGHDRLVGVGNGTDKLKLGPELSGNETDTSSEADGSGTDTETSAEIDGSGTETETSAESEGIGTATDTSGSEEEPEIPTDTEGRSNEAETPTEAVGRGTETEAPTDTEGNGTLNDAPIEADSDSSTVLDGSKVGKTLKIELKTVVGGSSERKELSESESADTVVDIELGRTNVGSTSVEELCSDTDGAETDKLVLTKDELKLSEGRPEEATSLADTLRVVVGSALVKALDGCMVRLNELIVGSVDNPVIEVDGVERPSDAEEILEMSTLNVDETSSLVVRDEINPDVVDRTRVPVSKLDALTEETVILTTTVSVVGNDSVREIETVDDTGSTETDDCSPELGLESVVLNERPLEVTMAVATVDEIDESATDELVAPALRMRTALTTLKSTITGPSVLFR